MKLARKIANDARMLEPAQSVAQDLALTVAGVWLVLTSVTAVTARGQGSAIRAAACQVGLPTILARHYEKTGITNRRGNNKEYY